MRDRLTDDAAKAMLVTNAFAPHPIDVVNAIKSGIDNDCYGAAASELSIEAISKILYVSF